MNRNVFMLSGLLGVSFVGMFWLMPRNPRVPVVMEGASEARPVTPAYLENPRAEEPAGAEGERLAEAYPQTEPDIEVQETEPSEPVQSAVHSPPLPTIEAVTDALSSDNDRGIRLAAINSLLLLGRQSTVAPAITQALRAASTDSDPEVAAQAGSALTEVERATH